MSILKYVDKPGHYMNLLPDQDVTLNIRYDAPEEVWQKIPLIYEQMPGWLGFGENGIPCWFNFDYFGNDKMVSASVEPGGLQLSGKMRDAEWKLWVEKFKKTASKQLGFEVGDVQDGFV